MQAMSKYNPDALCLTDENTGDNYFAIALSTSAGLSPYGITFDGISHDDKNYITATLHIPHGTEDAFAYVKDQAAIAVVKLSEIEDNVIAALKNVEAQVALVNDSITVLV
jgi:hypothetical protein